MVIEKIIGSQHKLKTYMDTKIYPRKKLAGIIQNLKKKGKKIGVTNGVFDIVHAGHVDYLFKAKKMCDVLIVSLNTDESVHLYKDPGRPINSQNDRAKVVAALGSVDYVTFHNERMMRDTLLAFKPDYYIKAGDYDITQMTSRDVLAQWGGKAVIIPAVKKYSTTNIFKTIIHTYNSMPVSLVTGSKQKNKAIFLDRDGVINEEIEYLHEPEKFRFIKGAVEAIKKMQNAEYKIVIITTQAGIGLGYFTKEDFFKVNKMMLKGFHKAGVIISKIYYCPHSLEDDCNCRKPKTGLLKRAEKDLNLDMKHSWMIGDKTSDIRAGKNMNCKTILVTSGRKGMDKEYGVIPDFISTDLVHAAEIIKSADLRKKQKK